jgi:hypothetical protein
MSTGDRRRTTQAVQQFIRLVDEARDARLVVRKKTAKSSNTRRG